MKLWCALLQTDPEIEIFEDDFVKHLEAIKMPNTKFQLLVKMLAKAIKEYSRTNLVAVRDENKFDYPDAKCVDLSKKIKELIDNTAIYADWNNNDNLKAELADNMIDLLYDNGYPPEWNDDVYNRVMDQVNNFKKYN